MRYVAYDITDGESVRLGEGTIEEIEQLLSVRYPGGKLCGVPHSRYRGWTTAPDVDIMRAEDEEAFLAEIARP